MIKTYLLLIVLVVAPATFCWYTKELSTDLYRDMSEDGSLKDLKNLTCSVAVDWDELNEGKYKIQISNNFNEKMIFCS